MEPYLAQLDPDRNAMRSFVEEYYRRGSVHIDTLTWPRGNINKLTFELNEEHTASSIACEIRGPFMSEYRFLARMPAWPEVTEPVFTRCLQGWAKHVLDGTINQSWNGCWTAHIMLHFYRQLTSTTFQTRQHMQIVHAVVIAFDIQTTSAIFIDDRLDASKNRDGADPWYLKHQLTLPTDTALQTMMGKQILRYILPYSHPFKNDILDLYDDYVAYCASYLTVTGARKEVGVSENIRDIVSYSLEEVTQETTRAFSWMRAGFYLIILYEVPRLLACYSNVLDKGPRRQLYRETITRALATLCTLDDIRDTKAFDVQLPWTNQNRAALCDYLPYVNDDMLQEVIEGDPHHAFLMAALELARSQSNGYLSLQGDEKAEVVAILRRCYWPNPQDMPEGSEARNKRHRQLCALFLKYDVRGYIKEHLLPQDIKRYLAVHNQVVQTLNMPADVLSYLMGSMVCEETTSRPEHVAEGIRAIMDRSMSELDEKARLEEIFAFVGGI